MCELHICRICLNTAVRGYKLEEHSLRNQYEYIMRQKLNPKDGLPQWVCYECVMMLHKFHKFKEKCFHGQDILKQVASRGKITYESISMINRCTENLISSIRIARAGKLVHTINIKHKIQMKNTKIKSNMNFIKPVEVILPLPRENNKTSIDIRNIDMGKQNTNYDLGNTNVDLRSTFVNIKIANNDISFPEHIDPATSSEDEKKYDEDVIKHEKINDKIVANTLLTSKDPNKSETSQDTNKYKQLNTIFDSNKSQHTNYDIGKRNTDSENTNYDSESNFDMEDYVKSSDDESLLDIAKKQGKVKRKSAIYNTKSEPKDKKMKTVNNKEIVLKNTQPLKHVLNLQFWKKTNLTEEEALREFKQREFSDYYLKAKFKCQDCYRGFSKNEMLIRHLKQRHDKSCGDVECRFCRMRFKLKHHLVKHIKEHLILYNCLICKLQCSRLTNAITHQERHTGIKKTCKHCGKEFSHLSTYYTHVRMSHRSAHVCVACGASFVSAAGLQQHTKLKHFDDMKQLEEEMRKRRSVDEAAANVQPAAQPAPAAEEVYCAKCDIKFMSRRAYNLHFFKSDNHDDGDAFAVLHKSRTNHRSRPKIPTSCEHCDKDFPSRQAYKKHHQAEHSHIPLYIPDERDICEICGASIQAKSIQYHMKSHTGERDFVCAAPDCGIRFTLKANMQRHYNVKHLGIVYPKYIRKNPGRRKKKTEEIHDNDFSPLVRTRTGYFL